MPDGELIRRREIQILLLEDSEIDAELLSAHLEKAEIQFRLVRAVNRREFVGALEDGGCELILADYSLPDFDGLSALNIAKALQPQTPFIFVSGVVGEEFATNALKRGATDYIMKRNLTRLATAVDRALEQARDRAERREAAEALHRSETRARLAIEGAELGLWDYDPRKDELTLDERCRSFFGLAGDGVLQYRAFLGFVHPDDRDEVDANIKAAVAWTPDRAGGFSVEFRVRSRGRLERWLASRGQAVFVDGVCTRFLGVLRDTTQERQVQDALRALTTNLEMQVADRTVERDAIWRLSRDIFAVAGFDGRLRRTNPAWNGMLGHDPEALAGANLTLLIHPDELSEMREAIRRLSRGEVIERLETRIRDADGHWRWISWTAAPEGDAFYAVGRDVSAERSAAEVLAQRNRELAAEIAERERIEAALRQMQRLEAVGQLTSGVAHDFNNLLTVILGNIAFIERSMQSTSSPAKNTGERLAQMRTAAERGAQLTAQMLAFSRRQKLEPKPVDLNDTVVGMRGLLQSTLGGSIRIETVLKPDLWPALVDPTQIELIILNLAINARDAMEVGGALTVETANVILTDEPERPEEPGPGEYVMIAVNDTGPGMDPEVLAKAFEPFFTTKQVGKGSGLGLAQVYGFAKQSGGGARIDSRAGEGASVKVFLPRAAAGATGQEPAPALPAPDSLGPRAVLVVDDDSAVREVTATMLSHLGLSVTEAGSGGAALDLLRAGRKFDLLLVDYAMPGMNGADVAREARALSPALEVIFITGYADLKALREVGEERIVRKPFRGEELARKIAARIGFDRDDKVVPLRR